jgi:dynactin complex subunit
MDLSSILSERDNLNEENSRLKERIKNAETRLTIRKNHAHRQGNWEREDAMDEALTLITGKEVYEREGC